MKKTYIKPLVTIHEVETSDSLLLEASGIYNDNESSNVIQSEGDEWAD